MQISVNRTEERALNRPLGPSVNVFWNAPNAITLGRIVACPLLLVYLVYHGPLASALIGFGLSLGLARPSAARRPLDSMRWQESGVPFQRSSRTASCSTRPGARLNSRLRTPDEVWQVHAFVKSTDHY